MFRDDGLRTEHLFTGFSGKGKGLNNPAWQDVVSDDDKENDGCIPRGMWEMEKIRNYTTNAGHKLPMAIPLKPLTYKGPRAGFLIHGMSVLDSQLKMKDRTSSAGCIVLNLSERLFIAQSGISVLEVR